MRHEQGTLDELVRDFMLRFEAVPEWMGYEKPKMHLIAAHLDLDAHGPFTAYHCMPWEAYVQVLKRLFDMTNYNSAPFTVASKWAAKSVLHYRDPLRASWYEDVVEHSSEFEDITALPTSRLVEAVAQRPGAAPLSARFLRSVSRGADDLTVNDSVVVMRAGTAWVGAISEMGQVVVRNASTGALSSVVRMWLRGCREATHVDGELEVSASAKGVAMLVCFESAQVHAVTRVRDECADVRVHRYRV